MAQETNFLCKTQSIQGPLLTKHKNLARDDIALTRVFFDLVSRPQSNSIINYIYIYINRFWHKITYESWYAIKRGCNGYRCRKWTRWHELISWTRLIAFHIALKPLERYESVYPPSSRLGSSASVRQLVYRKEISEFKPVKVRQELTLWQYPARAKGLGKYGYVIKPNQPSRQSFINSDYNNLILTEQHFRFNSYYLNRDARFI